jgi:uncharacterized protein (DUF2236 family)
MPGSPPVLGALDPRSPAPFGRGSVVRTVVASPLTALLVQRALVMEVAHPAVAAGVEHHSQFRRRPISRAWVTADTALRLTFGHDAMARGAVEQIYRVHDRINGHLEEPGDPGGPDGHPTPYTAHDASLLTWVWATLVDTAETAFTRWVRPFGPGEADAFYAEMRSLARFLGIPDLLLPGDRVEFSRYLEAMLERHDLGSGPVSHDVARQVLWFRHWSVPAPVVRVERALALATLDPRLVDRLRLRAGRGDVELGRRLDAWFSAYYRRLPIPTTPVPVLPTLYVLARRPTIGLGRRARSAGDALGGAFGALGAFGAFDRARRAGEALGGLPRGGSEPAARTGTGGHPTPRG